MLRNRETDMVCIVGVLLVLLFLAGCGQTSDNTLGVETLNLCQGKPDSDGDGLCDELEFTNGTDPNLCDTDGDGFCDGGDLQPLGPLTTTGNSATGVASAPSGGGGGADFLSIVGLLAASRANSALQEFVVGGVDSAIGAAGNAATSAVSNLGSLVTGGGKDATSELLSSKKIVIDSDLSGPEAKKLLQQLQLLQTQGSLASAIEVDKQSSYLRFVKLKNSGQCVSRKITPTYNWAVVLVVNYKVSGSKYSVLQIHFAQIDEKPILADPKPVFNAGIEIEPAVIAYLQKKISVRDKTYGSDLGDAAVDAVENDKWQEIAACKYSGFYDAELGGVVTAIDNAAFQYQSIATEDGTTGFFGPANQLEAKLGFFADLQEDQTLVTDMFMLTYVDPKVPTGWRRVPEDGFEFPEGAPAFLGAWALNF